MIEIRSVRDLARLYFIYRREFRLAFAATVAVAVLGAFLLPARYESEARLLVKPGRDTSTLPIEYGDRQALVAPSTQRDPIVDEEKLLTGRPIIRQVADFYLREVGKRPPQGVWKTIKAQVKAGFGQLLEWGRDALVMLGLAEWQSETDRLASRLDDHFSVSHQSGSAVMEVALTWDDPAAAQQIVARWIAIYIDERAKALGRKSLYQFYDGESHALAGQIAAYKREIAERLQAIDGSSGKEKLDSLSGRLNKMAAERANDQAELSSLQAGIASARSGEGRLPREVSKERELSLNPSQQDLRLKLNQLELERLDKLKNFMPGSQPVRELDDSIAAMKRLIAQQQDTVQRSENREPNALVTMLQRSRLERDLRAAELKARIAAYDEEAQRLRDERRRILSAEPELSRLERDLAVAEKNYLLYMDSLEKARIDRELDNSRISNIAVIEQATFSPGKVFPKSVPILLASLPAGLAVGCLVLYLCCLLDPRIHDGGRIERRFGIPLWTTLMELEGGVPPPAAFEASVYRLYSQLPRARLEAEGLTVGLTSSRRGEGVRFVIRHFSRALAERGVRARQARDERDRAGPGEVVLADASAFPTRHEAFIRLQNVDLILLVVEARQSTAPAVENALSVLNTAFGKVDGIIVNRRRFEIPDRLMAGWAWLKGAPR
ncbi:exopolysaccharide transport family protein [Chromobacterium violaceum]|uniref:exopolysaccharide transport family protein n=1 Tax=Chromobacterium violaceum TaxID=536 RepID=UPI0009DB443A|nr:lipopolysaccharide biosynthesis protein [Chromobacterium violaceum]OQS47786.1 lipopolysaccharide biosynthesis protein [Chromobacterium violaceum]OQS49916.1 lipopolysaccharide biosynthesis protein [Chromobacterium violaceum]QRO33240.1 hypothetical protein I6K04_00295 [Chromobacterium violaceum]QRQ16958.1 hypothetical protein I6K03_22435 [Chromobacterium violaceum]